jgi:ATP-dependent DNA helicase DinG
MRDKVHRADIVITNHTLLVRELLCESPTENSWLSEQDIVVIDEAHQLADCVDNTLAEFWSSYQCMSILRNLQPVIIRSFADQQVIREACNYSIKIIQRLSQIPFGDEYIPVSKNLLAKLLRGLVKLERHLFVQQQRDRQLRTIIPRLQRSLKTLKHWLILENEMSDQYVPLLDRRGKSLHLQLFPVAYGSQIESRLQEFHSVLFTSATLLHAVREDKLEAGRVVTSLADGVKTVRKLVFAGQNSEYLVCAPPFDYARQVVRFQPDVKKLPDEEGYLEAVLESLLPLLTMPAGKFLFLVTSHTARAKLIRLMQPFFGDHLYIAGAGDKIKTMKSFQSADSGVLLATASFREGVDLADCGLSGIVIDRLPFDSPADHLLMARAKKCRDQDVFINYQLPRAVQRLRQAFGRLIRRESDRGVFIVADPRLQRRWYGSVFLDGLPVMKLVPDIDAVRLFLSASD